MKVALIVEWLDSWRGGAETSTGQFVNHLLDLGVDLEIYTRSKPEGKTGVKVQTIECGGLSRSWGTIEFCRKADEAASRGGSGLIHALTPSMVADIYQPRGGTYAETLRRNVATRRTCTARAGKRLGIMFNPKQQRLLKLERKMFSRSDPPLVIALSDYVIQQLKTHYGLPASCVKKVYNGVDPDLSDDSRRMENRRLVRDRHKIDADAFLVLMVAHNLKLKGIRPWIDALTVLHSDRCSLTSLVVGKDKTSKWERMVQRRNLESAIRFVGPRKDISAYFHAVDLLVHPTFYDPCSRVVLEALAHNVPCITTRYDGASESVEAGVTGYVLEDPEDIAKLAYYVKMVCKNSLKRQNSDKAPSLGARISMRRHAEEIVAIYRTLMERKNE